MRVHKTRVAVIFYAVLLSCTYGSDRIGYGSDRGKVRSTSEHFPQENKYERDIVKDNPVTRIQKSFCECETCHPLKSTFGILGMSSFDIMSMNQYVRLCISYWYVQ